MLTPFSDRTFTALGFRLGSTPRSLLLVCGENIPLFFENKRIYPCVEFPAFIKTNMFLFRRGPDTAHALGSREKRQNVVTTIVKAISRGHKLKEEPSNEGNTVQHVLASAFSPLQTFPDDVLLEIFHCHRQAAIEYGPWKWHRLAQVCRRWRFVVFACPIHLDLRIVSTYDKPLQNAPKFWPVLPVIIWYPYPPTAFQPILNSSDEDNISDILKNPARVCEIDLDLARPLLAKFASSLEESFPALDHLRLRSHGTMGTIVLPDNFLDGSAPPLCVLHLKGTAVIILPRILLSSKNLISLRVEDITRDGYFTAEDLVIGLSTATRLKSLVLGFYPATITSFSPRGPSPSSSRIVLSSLTEFQYKGGREYLKDFVSRISAPVIEQITLSFFFCDSSYDNAGLCKLFGHGDTLRSSRCFTTRIRLSRYHMEFSHHFARIPSPGLFRLQLPYRARRPIPPLVAQVCLGLELQDVLLKVTHLEIEDCPNFVRRNNTEQDPTYWLDLLRALTGLKTLHVIGKLGSRIAFALAQITGETVRKILPGLQELHFGPDTPSSTPASIGPFIAQRQFHGLPVSVHFQKLNWVDDGRGERRVWSISY
jgi:hypothetical protein